MGPTRAASKLQIATRHGSHTGRLCATAAPLFFSETLRLATLRGDTYPGIAAAKATLVAPNLLVVNRAMDPDLAYRLTKALFEQKAQLVGIEPEAGHMDQLGAQEVAPLELHPGAARYYDEILRWPRGPTATTPGPSPYSAVADGHRLSEYSALF